MDHLLTPAPPSAEDVEAALATLERAARATPPDGALVLARRAVESCAARAAASGPLRAAAREKAHEVVRATVRLLGLFDGQSLELARTTAERRMKPSRPRTDAERATALSARLAPGAGAFLRGLPAPCLLASLSAGGARELATLAQTGRSFAAGDGRALLREAIVELCARAFPGRRVPTRRRPADAPPSPPSSLSRLAPSRRARAAARLRASRGARGENAQPPLSPLLLVRAPRAVSRRARTPPRPLRTRARAGTSRTTSRSPARSSCCATPRARPRRGAAATASSPTRASRPTARRPRCCSRGGRSRSRRARTAS